jgi:hypothetical protein
MPLTQDMDLRPIGMTLKSEIVKIAAALQHWTMGVTRVAWLANKQWLYAITFKGTVSSLCGSA